MATLFHRHYSPRSSISRRYRVVTTSGQRPWQIRFTQHDLMARHCRPIGMHRGELEAAADAPSVLRLARHDIEYWPRL